MRRHSSVVLLIAVLGVLAVTLGGSEAASAQTEGAPHDYCTQSPDRPLGWLFGDACRGHDECLDALGALPDRLERLACDDEFLFDLLDAPHEDGERVCGKSPVCQLLARVYHYVVRLVTVRLTAVSEGAGASQHLIER